MKGHVKIISYDQLIGFNAIMPLARESSGKTRLARSSDNRSLRTVSFTSGV